MIFTILGRLSGSRSSKIFHPLAKMSSKGFDEIKAVDIDPEGTFKYILVKVYADKRGSELSKNIVRGYKLCAYHSDIYDEVNAKELNPRKLESECLGGGRIKHEAAVKKIQVYGYSQGFGKADHEVTVKLLQQVYPDYSITWSDEGY